MSALAGLSACGHKHADGHDHEDRVEIYTGILPAADADGIRYTLQLEYDGDHHYNDGDYSLLETYLLSDSTATGGSRDDRTFRSEGDFKVRTEAGKKYIQLIQDLKDSQPGSNVGPINFYVESDSTLVLVNSDFQPSDTPGLNYTLKLSR